MSCNTCPQFATLPTCLETLVVGTVTGHPNEDFEVYLKNHTTGYIQMFEASTDGASLLSIDVPESFIPVPNHDYELYITDAEGDIITDKLTFVVDGTNYTCARLTFELIHGGADLAQYTSQTLTPIS